MVPNIRNNYIQIHKIILTPPPFIEVSECMYVCVCQGHRLFSPIYDSVPAMRFFLNYFHQQYYMYGVLVLI